VTPGSIPEAVLQQLAGRTRHGTRDPLVRLAARLRARDVCEYCLLPTLGRFQIDHVIPPSRWPDYVAGRIGGLAPALGRGGPHHLDNYAWACPFCNAAKSRQVAYRLGRRSHRLFDPRRDRWTDHFGFVHHHLLIVGLSVIGAATIEALRMNDSRLDGALGPRHLAILQGWYPPDWARLPAVDSEKETP
jgi:hypothetical protein